MRILPAVAALVLTIFATVPAALSLPVHGDEMFYAWSSRYYWNKIVSLDFSHSDSDSPSFSDPGWSPLSVWMVTGPTMTRIIYGAALAVTGSPAPVVPYNPDEPTTQGPETLIPRQSLLVLRAAAIACAALGFSFFTLRLGWLGLLATVLMFLIPEVPNDLGRAWAEGPLFLGFGLCALAYGTRWFGAACGLAVTFKLTGVATWPLLLIPGAGGSRRFALMASWASAAAVFTALTPQSWFLDGPAYLALMIVLRFDWFKGFSHRISTMPDYVPPTSEVGAPLGLFLPTRYILPFEWCLCLGLAWLLLRLIPRIRLTARGNVPVQLSEPSESVR